MSKHCGVVLTIKMKVWDVQVGEDHQLLGGSRTLPRSKKKGRRDKPYIKFHIGFLELANSASKIQPKDPIPDGQPKPYRPTQISDWINNPPGSGKVAKKARRRARKCGARAQAKAEAEAEEEAKRAKEQGDADTEELAQKKECDRELYLSIKKDMAERAERENQVKTRSFSRKIKEEDKKAAKDRKEKELEQKKAAAASGGKGKKRKADDDDALDGVRMLKKAREEMFGDTDDEVSDDDASKNVNKRKRGADDSDDQGRKKVRFADDYTKHDSMFSDCDTDSDCDSLFGDERVPEGPINTLPDLGNGPDSLPTMPQEVLERIVDHCDPVTRCLLGLTNKRFGLLAVTHGAGFPSIRDRYGGDLERHHFVGLLDPWMNQAYNEATEPVTIVEQQEREKLKKLRLCYICRKYLPISGKTCQYWKYCPKKGLMPVDPASQEARRGEVQRRQAARIPVAYGVYQPNPKLLPRITKVKPKAQTFMWADEDWSTLSVGLCKSRERMQDVKQICPKCTLTVHTVHLGWPPETPIVRWLEDGNPLGGRMNMGHQPQSGLVSDDGDLDEVDAEMSADE